MGHSASYSTVCESTMEGLGLRQVAVRIDNRYGEKVYDLEAEMVFTLSSGERVSWKNWKQMIGRGKRLKGYATIWDPKSQTPDRVLVNKGVAGLALWDTKTGISHGGSGWPTAVILNFSSNWGSC